MQIRLLYTKMLYLNLSNGLKMPALGLGTWQATDAELEKALDNALEIGYRHFDTAILYENEHIIGKVVNKWISSGKVPRQEFFITTKLPPTGMYPEKVRGYLRKSLQNLQLDYVDLYLLHSAEGIKDQNPNSKEIVMDSKVDHLAVWKEMEKLVEDGLARSIGVANFSLEQLENVLQNSKIKPANLQIELHVYVQQRQLVEFCKKQGVSVVAYSPLGSPGLNNFYAAYNVRKDLPDLMSNPIVRQVAKKHEKTEAQILLRHILQRGLGAIPKSTNKNRQLENFSVFDFSLDPDDMSLLDSLDAASTSKIGNWEPWTWFVCRIWKVTLPTA